MSELDSELLRDLVKAAGGYRQAAKMLRVLGSGIAARDRHVYLAGPDPVRDGAILCSALCDLAREVEEADEVREPQAGDRVIVRGKILGLYPSATGGRRAVLVVPRRDVDGLYTESLIDVRAVDLEHDTAAALHDDGVPG